MAEPTRDELPTEKEAMAYAEGYVAGLDAAKDQDVALLLKEVGVLKVRLAFEQALRSSFERRYEEVKARLTVSGR